jgi:hypothetical protein
MPDQSRRFHLHLADGRVWPGVEFPSGHVAVNHPDERDWFTVAVSTDGLLNDLPPQHPMHGARIEWTDAAVAGTPRNATPCDTCGHTQAHHPKGGRCVGKLPYGETCGCDDYEATVPEETQ